MEMTFASEPPFDHTAYMSPVAVNARSPLFEDPAFTPVTLAYPTYSGVFGESAVESDSHFQMWRRGVPLTTS